LLIPRDDLIFKATLRSGPRYQTQHDLVSEFVERANAMVNFGGELGLIESDEAVEILRAVSSDHPKLENVLMSEDGQVQSKTMNRRQSGQGP
jgi:hypothetical protein